MTREQLHGTAGFHAASLLAAAQFLLHNIPRKTADKDATGLIRNEGRVNGFLDAIEALQAAAQPKPPETEKKTFAPYSQPAESNQNRP